MLSLVLIISVPIVLLLIWAVVFDVKQRRRREPLTAHNPRKVAKEMRIKAEGKGNEWTGH
jgi:hypothetical protein